MSYRFTPGSKSPYAPGKFFLGLDPETGQEVGIDLERHVLTVAGSGTGKGSCVVIPNLLRWRHNALVIDPGGGNTRATWKARQEMGQEIHVIDPTGVSLQDDGHFPGVPAELLKTFNPLLKLDPKSRTYSEDLGTIGDGLVMRHDPRHATWDNAARDILTGLIDYFCRLPNAEDRTLPNVREALLMAPDEMKEFYTTISQSGYSSATRAAAAIVLGDLEKPNGFLGNARDNTNWLSYQSINQILGASTCDISDIKTKYCTIYLVIDPDYLIEHARFLRIFVRMAISEMSRGDTGSECLFILDEFFSLGKIEYLEKAAGLMRKNGVHLWPILQNYNQLISLYTPSGADAFTANADALMFFGLDQDKAAQSYVSGRIGNLTPDEAMADIPQPPKPHSAFIWGGESARRLDDYARAEYQRKLNQYSHTMRTAGSPRLTADEIAELTGKPEGGSVARSMIVFGKAGDTFNLILRPYFEKPLPPEAKPVEEKSSWWRSLFRR